jgi:flagellin-like protein
MLKIYKKKFQRKAVSPLIATILLVAVALSLAGILYSWSSQNAKETTSNMSETTTQWSNCSSVNLYIQNCRYDSESGVSLILYDDSQIEIDNNLSLIVIDVNSDIATSSFAPNFSNSVMSVKTSNFSNAEDFHNLGEPIDRVRIFVDSCPDRAAITTNCE